MAESDPQNADDPWKAVAEKMSEAAHAPQHAEDVREFWRAIVSGDCAQAARILKRRRAREKGLSAVQKT